MSRTIARLDEYQFRRKVASAAEQVARLLKQERNPKPLTEARHTYQDKFDVVNFLGNESVAAFVQCLKTLSLIHI